MRLYKMGVRSAQERSAVKIYYFLSTNTSVERGRWEKIVVATARRVFAGKE
jgi:hypothetical protein